jgi:mRNA-degrading endonuclease RelE of RelBE toxin-antitoxin system
MKLVLTRTAQRHLGEVSPKRRVALVERLQAVAERPFATHRNVERIKGQDDAFRLRQDDWRAVYRIDRAAGEMRVLDVDPRGRIDR